MYSLKAVNGQGCKRVSFGTAVYPLAISDRRTIERPCKEECGASSSHGEEDGRDVSLCPHDAYGRA